MGFRCAPGACLAHAGLGLGVLSLFVVGAGSMGLWCWGTIEAYIVTNIISDGSFL